MALDDVTIHRAVLVGTSESVDDPVEGDWDETPKEVTGEPIPCILFLPGGSEEPNPFKPRQIVRPTLLLLPEDEAGGAVAPRNEQELVLTAATEPGAVKELLEGRWQLDGDAQPFGPPGEVIGLQATLKRVNG